MRRSATSGPYESAVSMRLIPNSTARCRTAIASEWLAGSPQMPAPVSRIVPKPSRRTGMSPPIKNVPLASAGRAVDRREDRTVSVIALVSFIIFRLLFGCLGVMGVRKGYEWLVLRRAVQQCGSAHRQVAVGNAFLVTSTLLQPALTSDPPKDGFAVANV